MEDYPDLLYMKGEARSLFSLCKVAHYVAEGLKEYGFHYR